LEFGNVCFVEGGKPEYLKKNPQLRARVRSNNKLHPYMAAGQIEPGPHLCEVNVLTTEPSSSLKFSV